MPSATAAAAAKRPEFSLNSVLKDTVRVKNEGPRTRVGQPKMKYWKLHELHRNEVKMCIPYEHMPKS